MAGAGLQAACAAWRAVPAAHLRSAARPSYKKIVRPFGEMRVMAGEIPDQDDVLLVGGLRFEGSQGGPQGRTLRNQATNGGLSFSWGGMPRISFLQHARRTE